MSPEPFKKMILCCRRLSASMKLLTLDSWKMYSSEFCFGHNSHTAAAELSVERNSQEKKKRCHMAVRLLYTASNYLRKCCLTCTHLLKMSPESSRVLTTLIFFLFAPFPLGLESRGFFIFCQRSVKISKYCISPSVRIASNVGLEKDSYQWKNVCSSPVVVVVMMYCTMSLFNPLS